MERAFTKQKVSTDGTKFKSSAFERTSFIATARAFSNENPYKI